MDVEGIKNDAGGWYANLSYGQWVQLPVDGPRPAGRYKHAAIVVDTKLYVFGGSRNGRRFSDFQVLDLKEFKWSSLNLTMDTNTSKLENGSVKEVFLATSGHNTVLWGRKLLIFGQPSRTLFDYSTVSYVDLDTNQCGNLEISGRVPVAREGHSVTLVDSKVILFGGEDIKRRLLNDTYVLDLNTLTWHEVETTQPPPSPRYDHTASVHAERYLLIFGGCSGSTCLNDLHVFDMQTLEWSQPETRGDIVTPRAGHSGVTINGNWFIVGGGDNKSGARETIVLDMTKLAWSIVTRMDERDPLVSEGISVCSVLLDGERYLVSFGGYNGKYNNEVFILRPTLKDPSRPKIYQSPAAAAAAASVSAAYLVGIGKPAEPNKFGDSQAESKQLQENPSADIDSMREEKRLLESSLKELVESNSSMRRKIDDINNNHAELTKELHSVQGQLVAERSRCFKLEAQIAELHDLLRSLPAIEAEVSVLRKQISILEDDMSSPATIEKQNSGGVWTWLSGGP